MNPQDTAANDEDDGGLRYNTMSTHNRCCDKTGRNNATDGTAVDKLWFSEHPKTISHLSTIFNASDKNKDGKIDFDQLCKFLKMNNESFIPEIVEAVYPKITLNSYPPRNEYNNQGKWKLSRGQISPQTVSALRSPRSSHSVSSSNQSGGANKSNSSIGIVVMMCNDDKQRNHLDLLVYVIRTAPHEKLDLYNHFASEYNI